MSFDAHEEHVRELFNRKVYNVPRNQRRYVWNKDNWQELFDDVLAVVNEKSNSHFLGSIVLKTDPMFNGLPHYSIIDGQQRTITLAIFLTSIMFWMKKNGMEDDFNGTKPYVIAKDDKNNDVVMVTAENNGSLESIINSIISLSGENVKKATVTSIVEGSLLNKADKNIGDAFKFYMNEINSYYESKGHDSQVLIKLRDVVRDIIFVNITATTEEDSYTIFEILNARGLDLEDHELLKNYIMRYIQPEGDRDKAKTEWNRMESSLGSTNIKKFVRHYTIHKYGDYKSKKETSNYKIIRDWNKGKDSWSLLSDLEKKANYYLKLINPIKNGDDANCSEVEYRVYSFFKKKRQEQMRPVLLSLISNYCEGNLSEELYEKTIEFLYNYYVCYNIIGEEKSNRLTDTLNKYAAKLSRNCSSTVINQFVEEIQKKLPSKEMFINSFSNIGWSNHESIYEGEKNKTRVQTVLEVYERHLNHGLMYDDFTIEHVLPDSKATENGQIGNLIPLEYGLNKRCKDKELTEKLEIYKESIYRTPQLFCKRYSNTTFDAKKRTKYMAEYFFDNILKL